MDRTQVNWGRVLTAMVTPFDPSGRISEAGVIRLVNHLFETGSDGIVVSGTTGESPTLSHAEKCELYGLVKTAAGGRGPILAGTGSYDTAESVALSRDAEAVGVDGLLLVTPYYNKPSQEGLYRHFRAVAEAVRLPVMLYNVPGRTSANLRADTCLRIARDVPNVVAVKEASGDLLQITDIVAGAPSGFRVYSGDDGLVLPILSVGGCGVVSVTSHLVGRGLQAMIAAHFSGDAAAAARLHAQMLPVVRACFQPTTPSPVPLKAALNMLGLDIGAPRMPLIEADAREQDTVRQALAEYGLLRQG